MRQSFLGNLQNNTGYASALSALGDPLGKALLEGSQINRQNQLTDAQLQKHQMEVQEQIRSQKLAETLPKVLGEIDWNDPQDAQSKLSAAGLKPQEIYTLFNVHKGTQDIGLDKETAGLNREKFGLEKQKFGLDQQAFNQKLAGGVDPVDASKIEKELRSEIKDNVKEYEHVKGSYDNIKELSKHKTGASDMGMIYSWIKLLDPTSTVGPGEKASAEKAGGLSENVRGQINELLSQGSLSEKQRQDIISGAKTLYGAKAKSYKKKTAEYKKLAENYKVNYKNIVLNESEEDEQEFENTPQVTGSNQSGGNNYSKEQALAERERRRTQNTTPVGL